jgi:single-strand DNA-binding protein
MSDNTITVTGNVTRDPELKFLNSGQAALRMSIAVNRRWQNRQTQEWEERVSYFDICAYGTLAENVANSIHKGDRAIVSGRLEQRSWETEAAEKRSVVEINADAIGPDLKWATAVVSRTAPSGNGPGGEPRPARGPARTYPSQPPAHRPFEYDEEPF